MKKIFISLLVCITIAINCLEACASEVITRYWSVPVVTLDNSKLMWSAAEPTIEHIAPPTGYHIYWSKDRNFSSDSTFSTITTSLNYTINTSYLDKCVYYYKVRATNANYLYGEYSNVVAFDNRIKYKIVYNANGGKNAPDTQYKIHDVDISLTKDVPTRDGYDFVGWATSSNGTPLYQNSSFYYRDNADLYLYAIWRPKTYLIYYNFNDSTQTNYGIYKMHNEKELLLVPIRDGYCFLGWKSDLGVIYGPNSYYDENKKVVLSAIWGQHSFGNDCDITCNVCGETRDTSGHVYDDNKDATCNICGAEREVVTYISGDVNGDGEVNNKDLGVLRRWLNDWDVTIDELASDVNRDGDVNNKDLGILRRYLNDWDVELK